jgi:hypothetical protein
VHACHRSPCHLSNAYECHAVRRTLADMDAFSDAASDWSQVVANEDVLTRESVLSLIADMRAEHEKQQKLLRNQTMVMAALSNHPHGCGVLAAARAQCKWLHACAPVVDSLPPYASNPCGRDASLASFWPRLCAVQCGFRQRSGVNAITSSTCSPPSPCGPRQS